MSNGNNQKIEALLKLKDQTWARFDCRRRTQWKTDISIWTVLVAILALIAKGDVPPFTLPMQITATVAGLLLVVLHFLWSVDIGRAFRLDNKTSVSFEKMILEEMQASHGEELTAETDARVKKSGKLTIWGHFLETGITAILIVCLGAIIWVPKSPKTNTENDAPSAALQSHLSSWESSDLC